MSKGQRSYKMSQSPFYDSELREASDDKKISVKLPTKAYNRIMKYSKESQGISQDSRVFRELCFDELDKICLTWQTFNHLEVFMLIPKSEDWIELENNSEIIALVNSECDYVEGFEPSSRFNIGRNDCNIVYHMEYFMSENFPSDKLFNTKTSCVKYIPNEKLNSFHALKDELSRLYPHLDVEDCYFVHFPLNNYFDIKRDGQFQHESSEYSQHEGAYVFHDIVNNKTLYCVLDWKYSFDTNSIYFDFTFRDKNEFAKYIQVYEGKSNHKEKLRNSFQDVLEARMSNLDDLLELKEKLENDLAFVNHLIDNASSSDD